MALAETNKAIGAVTSLLKSRLGPPAGFPDVWVGRPEQHSDKTGINLFLYEVSFDPHLRNTPLDEGQKPPLWLVLKYLLTAYGNAADGGDSIKAHEDLGLALRLIYEDDFLQLNSSSDPALKSNPEKLRITFDESSPELLSKLMQGQNEKLRLSVAFQVRPVMIASVEPPEYSLLVGVDYTKTSPAINPDYVGLKVIPSLGASISEIEPKGFEVGDEVILRGTDLHLSDLSVRLGTVDLPVTMQRPDELHFKVDAALIDGTNISAGSHPVTVVQTLETGKKRSSNMVVGNLVPTLTMANVVTLPGFFAAIDLTGRLLGNDTDDVVIAFYQNGRVVKMFDTFTFPTPTQTSRTLRIPEDADPFLETPLPPGEYLAILRVNGQQALQSPRVNLV